MGEETAETFTIVEPPICYNNLGEKVNFLQKNNPNSEVTAGMAIRGPDRKPIVYRFNYEKSPPEFQIFVDYHECAHHQTGHVDQPHPPINSYEHLMNESIADCLAILRMRDEWMRKTIDYEIFINTLRYFFFDFKKLKARLETGIMKKSYLRNPPFLSEILHFGKLNFLGSPFLAIFSIAGPPG